MVRPFHIVIFAVAVFFCVILISLFGPSVFNSAVGSNSVRFPHFFYHEKPQLVVHKDISKIVNFGNLIDSIDGIDSENISNDFAVSDSGKDTGVIEPNSTFDHSKQSSDTKVLLPHDNAKVAFTNGCISISGSDRVSVSNISNAMTNNIVLGNATNANVDTNAEKYKGVYRKLEYPDGVDTVLYPFFRELNLLASGDNLIHILHFGDSQIEGDRVSSYLRNQFQRKFGGSGIGMIPIVANGPASLPYTYEVSPDWERYSAQDKVRKSDNNGYGIYMSYFKVKPMNLGGVNSFNGWINLKWANTGNILIQRFTTCKVYFGNNVSPFDVELKQNDTLLDKRTISGGSVLNCIQWNFKHSQKDLMINLNGAESPDFYGVSLTGNSGIALDNIPLRGSSGLEFTHAQKQLLSQFMKMLKVKLLILQFGVNVVPNIVNGYNFYQKGFSNQLRFLKEIAPDLQIIVMGVNDMARNTENGIESYPNIEKVRDAQRNAALANGCVFWDTFEAMGGENSMYSWVNSVPALAQKDYTHLTTAGAKIIGEMFFRSLIIEYNKFLAYQKGVKS